VSDSPSPDGGSPISLDGLRDFVDRVESGDLDEEDRTIDRHHPLTVVVENTLESLTGSIRGDTIIGFSRKSENKLALKRRRLENRKENTELQHLLYSYERLSKAIREAGYGASDPVTDAEFFEETIPEWLRNLEDWARAENYDQFADTVAEDRELYLNIAEEIVD
jgi:hypothetical protein